MNDRITYKGPDHPDVKDQLLVLVDGKQCGNAVWVGGHWEFVRIGGDVNQPDATAPTLDRLSARVESWARLMESRFSS